MSRSYLAIDKWLRMSRFYLTIDYWLSMSRSYLALDYWLRMSSSPLTINYRNDCAWADHTWQLTNDCSWEYPTLQLSGEWAVCAPWLADMELLRLERGVTDMLDCKKRMTRLYWKTFHCKKEQLKLHRLLHRQISVQQDAQIHLVQKRFYTLLKGTAIAIKGGGSNGINR